MPPTDLPDTTRPPLTGVHVVTIAVNVPGPVAAMRLAALGASVTKVEPPSGDPLMTHARAYYDEASVGQEVVVLDLKSDEGRAGLEDLLAGADVFLTSHRPSALDRLGIGADAVAERHPGLVQVAIVGQPAPDQEVAGHDLTYQAVSGTLTVVDGRPRLPSVLLGDLVGAERAVSETLALLVARGVTGEGGYVEVALSDAADAMTGPLRHGMTSPGGVLGGGFPGYDLYETADGYIACAALEPHFFARLGEALGQEPTRENLTAAFLTRTAREWDAWALEHDLPLAVVTTA